MTDTDTRRQIANIQKSLARAQEALPTLASALDVISEILSIIDAGGKLSNEDVDRLGPTMQRFVDQRYDFSDIQMALDLSTVLIEREVKKW